MENKKFMDWVLDKNKKIVSVTEACGAGAETTVEFLTRVLNFKKLKKATTKSITYRDAESRGMDAKEFKERLDNGLIIGRYYPDMNSSEGIGYGYRVDEIMLELDKGGKVLLAPTIDDIVSKEYKALGTTDKIALGFKSAQGVFDKATHEAGITSGDIIEAAIYRSLGDTAKLEQYARESGDKNFHMQYVDGYGMDPREAKKA